jgi:murein DD-endopeptidase MepM/ murein hydrolase activator NlpD
MANNQQENSGVSLSGTVQTLRFLIKLVGVKGVLIIIVIFALIVFSSAMGAVAEKAGGKDEFSKVIDSTKGMTNEQVIALFTGIIENGRTNPAEKLNWPVPFTRRIISPYGERYDPSVGETVLHDGIDISAPEIAGKAVVAVAGAKVLAVDTAGTGQYGKWVQLDLGNGKRCMYAYLDKILVSNGQDVWINQPLGTVATGTSEGGMQPHLHFSLTVDSKSSKSVDPMPFFKDADKLGDAPLNPNGETDWPVPFTRNITSLYGERVDPITKITTFHEGIDISALGIAGKPVVAIANARVADVNTDESSLYGKNVTLDLGSGIICLYAYLGDISVSNGQMLHANQTIGTVGSTGEGMGPHLHFQIKWKGYSVNPLPFLK